MDQLEQLSGLIHTRNEVTAQIAAIIGRPAQRGHVGEYIAAGIFGIALERSAVKKGIDGHFTQGPLAGRTVNVKWYGKQESVLDINIDRLPDFYLVMTGPKASAMTSRGTTRPWLISSVFLFDARELVAALRQRGVKIGIATSVASQFWDEAQIYPVQRNSRLQLSTTQKEQLALFG